MDSAVPFRYLGASLQARVRAIPDFHDRRFQEVLFDEKQLEDILVTQGTTTVDIEITNVGLNELHNMTLKFNLPEAGATRARAGSWGRRSGVRDRFGETRARRSCSPGSPRRLDALG